MALASVTTKGIQVIRLDTRHSTYYDVIHMTPRRITTFRIEEELLDALRGIWERDGISVPEQVRRAIRWWIEAKGVKVKSERKRAVTRKRP